MTTKLRGSIEAKVVLELTEGEAGVLDAIAGYGHVPFLKAFKEHLGKHYIEKYEHHVESLFEQIQATIPGVLSRAEEARRVFNGQMVAVRPKPEGEQGR